MITAVVNALYPNRISLTLGAIQGPLSSSSLGAFSPIRDLEVYVDGTLLTIQSGAYDEVNNRYLTYTTTNFDINGVVQVLHHMPLAPFTGTTGTLPGFALIASVSNVADT
jgi:hypothetical protein